MIEYLYNQCTVEQQGDIRQALGSAEILIRDALKRVEIPDDIYVKWFGNYALTKDITKKAYSDLYITIKSMSMRFDCSCGGETKGFEDFYAYVLVWHPFEIYLCPRFWPATMTGPSGKAGVLVHELSHFVVVAGTEDYFHTRYALMFSFMFPIKMAHNSYSIEGYLNEEP